MNNELRVKMLRKSVQPRSYFLPGKYAPTKIKKLNHFKCLKTIQKCSYFVNYTANIKDKHKYIVKMSRLRFILTKLQQ